VKFSHRYKYECDSFRLLIDEFERQVADYNNRNEFYIKEVVAHDLDEYQAPKYVSNYKSILTGTLIIEAQGLLDFFLPLMVGNLAKIKEKSISPFDKSWKGGNILCWTKHVLIKELCLSYDFGRGPHCKLKEFYNFRNDLIHYGGYVSSYENKSLLKGKNGISSCEFSGLYVVEFSYCRSVINDIEKYFCGIFESV
jgi:hypothetical protein